MPALRHVIGDYRANTSANTTDATQRTQKRNSFATEVRAPAFISVRLIFVFLYTPKKCVRDNTDLFITFKSERDDVILRSCALKASLI